METVRFGIIGCGTMGREFATAVARWFHLPRMRLRPEVVAICNRSLAPEKIDWFTDNIATVRQVTDDHRRVLENPDVEAVYVAVPHNMHEELYCTAIEAGKHLLGEKPFGIDRAANDAIVAHARANPDCLVRCASQFPFFPAVQRIGKMVEAEAFGEIIEVSAGFLHCSDLNPDKPINWKRMVEHNGRYGCMGDLGSHAIYVPIRAGWEPLNVRAVLSNIILERRDRKGRSVPCDTWDNATLVCEAGAANSARVFPLTLRIQRISPGEKNNWYLQVLGTRASARFTTKAADTLEILEYAGGEQAWRKIDMGHEVAYKSITPQTHQFGMSDAILQMLAAFLCELDGSEPPALFAGCITPDETALSHRLFTAALESHSNGTVVAL